jgi:hypothetical protein
MPEDRRRGALEADPEIAALVGSLADLGPRLAYPADPGAAFAGAVAERIEARRPDRSPAPVPARARLGRWLDAQRPVRRALVLAIALVLVLAVAAAAATLGVRGIRIIFGPPPATVGPSGVVITPSPRPLGSNLLLGEPMSLQAVRSRVAFPVEVPSLPGLGRPQAYLSEVISGGAVNLVYPAGPGIPGEGASGVGVLITEFVGRVDRQFIDKFAKYTNDVQEVRVGGSPGVWIAGGTHEVAYIDADGRVLNDTLRLSGSALLWRHGEVTLRLETLLPLDRALAIAESVR